MAELDDILFVAESVALKRLAEDIDGKYVFSRKRQHVTFKGYKITVKAIANAKGEIVRFLWTADIPKRIGFGQMETNNEARLREWMGAKAKAPVPDSTAAGYFYGGGIP